MFAGALSVLRTLFGREPVADFGPKALRTYQRSLVELPPQHFANGASKREGLLARTGKLRAEGSGFYAPRDEAH